MSDEKTEDRCEYCHEVLGDNYFMIYGKKYCIVKHFRLKLLEEKMKRRRHSNENQKKHYGGEN